MVIKNSFIFVFLLAVISCKKAQLKSVTFYKTKGLVEMPYDVLESTFWDSKNYNDLDSLNISLDKVLLIQRKIQSIQKINSSDIPFMHPEYAMIIRSKQKSDTIYLDEMIINGYSTNNNYLFIDSNDILFDFLKNEDFISERTRYFRKEKVDN